MGIFSKEERKPDRFKEKCRQGYGLGEISVMVDIETGVNYIFGQLSFDGGFTITPLLGADGKIVVDDLSALSFDE